MSVLISSVIFQEVRAAKTSPRGEFAHYVRRDVFATAGAALCGVTPKATPRGVVRWTAVHALSPRLCMACHAEACRVNARICR